MKAIVLTGGPAAGKTTLANRVGAERARCAVIDVDQVRHMVRQPHVAPWGGDEGRRQQVLGVTNTCGLALNFLDNDFDVVITDVLTDETAAMYRESLPHLLIVRLAVDLETALERSELRGEALTHDEFLELHRAQHDYAEFEVEIDTTTKDIELLALELNALLDRPE